MKLTRIYFHKHGDCWRFFSAPTRFVYFNGNLVIWQWWRIGFALERRKWVGSP